MQNLLKALRSIAEPTRLRLLALIGRGAFCVMDFVEILEQSQPRLSRHLRLLGESGLVDRVREGPNVWFTLPPVDSAGGSLARALLARLPDDDALLEADRRMAARVLAERARIASETFQARGADWDEMRALDLHAGEVEQALLEVLPSRIGRLLDIGTGTGQLLELAAPRVDVGLGIDASKAMLALARVRLAKPGLENCTVRLADMYSTGLPAGSFDVAVLQMVLHHAEEPRSVVDEAVRLLRPGGLLVVVDLAIHAQQQISAKFAHRWQGFNDSQVRDWFGSHDMTLGTERVVNGNLDVRLWSARTPAVAPAAVDAKVSA